MSMLLSVVSVVLVTDPFGEWTVEQLDTVLPDRRTVLKSTSWWSSRPRP